MCQSSGTQYYRQPWLWGRTGAGQHPSPGFKISKAKDGKWLEQGHEIQAWRQIEEHLRLPADPRQRDSGQRKEGSSPGASARPTTAPAEGHMTLGLQGHSPHEP